jgi:hypothetical protein
VMVIIVSTIVPPVVPQRLNSSVSQRLIPSIPDLAMTHQIPIWLDCDPGHDDVLIPSREFLMYQAFALLYAAYSPYLELIGKISWTIAH